MPEKLLKVYYGYQKLNKIRKKRALCIYFENDNNNPEKNLKTIDREIYLVYTRFQTKDEAKDAKESNRMFYCASMFIDNKTFKGDIDKVLEHNHQADQNHVSIEERDLIKEKLKDYFLTHYNN